MRQKNLQDFTDDSTELYSFDRYGPTADDPAHHVAPAAFETLPESTVDRREINGTGLAPSDFELIDAAMSAALAVDYEYHPADADRQDARDRHRKHMSELEARGELEHPSPDASADGSEGADGTPRAAPDGGRDLEVRVDDSGSAFVTDDWEGENIYTSWGYDQTNVNIARIIEVSGSGKTVVARMAHMTVDDRSTNREDMAPAGDVYGDRFRLHVREGYDGTPSFRGSYPYIDGDSDNGERKGSFGRYTEPVRQTPHTHRH